MTGATDPRPDLANDDDLQRLVARALGRHEPLPDSVSQLVDDAWDLMRLDASVAELVHDTLIDDVSMRTVGVVDRTLVFRGQGVDIDVIIDPTGSLIGQLSPVAAGSGIVITDVAQHSIEVDANGRFVADPVPGRRFRLVIRTAVATVITAWQPMSR